MKTYRWSYDERVTLEEFIKRITPMVERPVSNMWEMEGDLFMSDCRMLSEAAMRLHNLVDDMEGNETPKPQNPKTPEVLVEIEQLISFRTKIKLRWLLFVILLVLWCSIQHFSLNVELLRQPFLK